MDESGGISEFVRYTWRDGTLYLESRPATNRGPMLAVYGIGFFGAGAMALFMALMLAFEFLRLVLSDDRNFIGFAVFLAGSLFFIGFPLFMSSVAYAWMTWLKSGGEIIEINRQGITRKLLGPGRQDVTTVEGDWIADLRIATLSENRLAFSGKFFPRKALSQSGAIVFGNWKSLTLLGNMMLPEDAEQVLSLIRSKFEIDTPAHVSPAP